MSAFKDFTPGQGEASAAPAAAASEEPDKDEGGEEEVAESSGGGGSYPPHTVMGLPALSPTMSQGEPPASCTGPDTFQPFFRVALYFLSICFAS